MRLKTALPDSMIRCRNCRYYVQHYILYDSKRKQNFVECNSGHCVQARIRNTKPDLICEAYDEKEEQLQEPFLKQIEKKRRNARNKKL